MMARDVQEREFPGKCFPVAGHLLHVVHTPEDRLQAVLALIDSAETSLRMIIYMFDGDTTGREVLAHLVAAAERGVEVQLMIDSFGSGDVDNAFFLPLETAGGHYHVFSSHLGWSYLVRNHQKMIIADGEHILIGGFNITDQYFGRSGDRSWEDFGAIFSGPSVEHLAIYYDQLSDLSRGGNIKFGQMRRLIRDWRPGNGTLQWLLGGPTNRISPWALYLKRDLERANRLDLAVAYFSPSQTILRRIAKVTRKGQSRMIMAGKTDNGATIFAARVLYRYLLRRGARIFEYQPLPLHTKLLVIDNAVYIGSANLDVRSLFINMEIMLRIEDAAVASYVRELIDGMARDSLEQTRELLRSRDSWWARFRAGLAYFLVNTVDYSLGRRISFGLLTNRNKDA